MKLEMDGPRHLVESGGLLIATALDNARGAKLAKLMEERDSLITENERLKNLIFAIEGELDEMGTYAPEVVAASIRALIEQDQEEVSDETI